MNMPMLSLKEVANFINGKAFKPTDWSEQGIPIIRIQNLNGLDKPFNYWAGPLEKEVNVKRNDLLLAWSGTPGTSFGAHIWRGGAAVLNQHIFRVDLKENLVTKEWAKFVINAQLNTLIGMAHGGVGLQHVTKGMVEGLEIPVPPLPEQRRIAAILDQADALRAKRREALAQLDSLTQSIFIEMFGDPVTNPLKIKVVQLSEITTRITDGVHQKPNYTEDGVPFISVKNITSGVLKFESCKFISLEDHKKFTKRCRAEYLDILYTKVGATYGRPALVNTHDEFSLYVSVCLIKPERTLVDSYFLCSALGTAAIKNQADSRIKGIGVPDLHLDQIQKLLIPLPTLDEQRKFSERVAAVQSQKDLHHASLSELDNLFASLQHRAFRGEL